MQLPWPKTDGRPSFLQVDEMLADVRLSVQETLLEWEAPRSMEDSQLAEFTQRHEVRASSSEWPFFSGPSGAWSGAWPAASGLATVDLHLPMDEILEVGAGVVELPCSLAVLESYSVSYSNRKIK